MIPFPNWSDLYVWISGFVSATVAGIFLLVRKLLTNEKQIIILEERLETVEQLLKEVRDDVKLVIWRNTEVDR